MKYPQLVSTPTVVKEWLEAELECLGIDSAAYARTVLSLLSRDTIDPAEVIQSGYVLVANKGGRGVGGLGGPHPPRTREEEELKRAEVIECLCSASEDHSGIQLLVDQLISMLKQLPAASEPAADTASDSSSYRPATGDPPPPDDPVLRYEAAFPALSCESPGVIPLTYFSKMGRTAATPAAGLWCAELPPAAAVWPTTLDHLRLLLPPPPACTASLEPAAPAPPPPPPKPPEPAEEARIIRPSAETHFQPIRRASGDDGGAEWPPPATYDARLYMRSDSGGLYLEDEGSRPAAEPPQKYMIYREEESSPAGARRGLAPKFKLSCNEKYCQTDEAADGAGRDLLQILVSGEQAGEARGAPVGDADDDDDSSYEVLSSLQQTLHSIYEDGSETADSGAEPELECDQLADPRPAALVLARRPSAFARVRRPSAGHRPLYLRGGGADSLLAAVYTGGAWSPGDGGGALADSVDHRPLYARQPAAAAGLAEFAQHRQLTSGRISGTVYGQGPTEYPALRYQLAGRDLPEVTFCGLSGDTYRSGPLKEDLAIAWDAVSGVGRSSREPSIDSDAVTTTNNNNNSGAWPFTSDGTLWQAAGERERRDRSADRALWEARADPGRRCSSVDSAIWEQEPTALWEAPNSLVEPEGATVPAALWEAQGSLVEPKSTTEPAALWEAPRSLVEPEGATDPAALWEAPRSLVEPEGATEPAALWEAPRSLVEPEGATEPAALWKAQRSLVEPEGVTDPAALWEAPRSLVELEGATDPAALWEAPRDLVEPEGAAEHTIWEPRRSRAERESSVELTLWETSGEPAERTETTVSNIWESEVAPVARDTSIDALWASRELSQREQSIDEASWERRSDHVSQREKSVDEPAVDTRWEVLGELPRRQGSVDRSLWQSPTDLSLCDGSVDNTIWEAVDDPPPRRDLSAERTIWESAARGETEEETPWRVAAALSRQRSADLPLWEAEEAAGWPSWDDPLIRAPEHIWRRAEPAATLPEWSGAQPERADGRDAGKEEEGEEEEVGCLLWRLGGDDVLAQTGLYSTDAADAGRSWEFIDENNVKNKIDANAGTDGGPLASELADGESDWRVLPALRHLSKCLGLSEGAPLPDGVALKAWALEEQWRRDDGLQRPTRDRRGVRRSDRKRPCSYFMEGNCKRNDCKFSHDLSAITCVFWEESGCFKGVHCPFLHGYPADDEEEDEDSSDSAKRAVPKKSFKLEKEDFPSLHNMKKWHRNDEEDNRKAGRRNCRRHKSFSDATLGVGSGEPELHRPAIGGRGKRRRHHSKSEGVRPADTGARRP